jgi:hypothetical protein
VANHIDRGEDRPARRGGVEGRSAEG